MEIEKQQEVGTKSLEERNKYLMEINLEDLVNASDENQQYWLLAIRVARESSRLRTHNRTRPRGLLVTNTVAFRLMCFPSLQG